MPTIYLKVDVLEAQKALNGVNQSLQTVTASLNQTKAAAQSLGFPGLKSVPEDAARASAGLKSVRDEAQTSVNAVVAMASAVDEAQKKSLKSLKDYTIQIGTTTAKTKGLGDSLVAGLKGVDQSLGRCFENLLSGADVSFNGIRKAFASMLTDMANTAVLQPITISIVTALGGQGGKLTASNAGLANGSSFGANSLLSGISDTVNSAMAKWLPGLLVADKTSANSLAGNISGSAPGGATPLTGNMGQMLGKASPYAAIAMMGKSFMDSLTAKMSNSNPIKRGWNVIDENSMQGGPGFFGWGDVADLLRKDRFSQASMAISPVGVLGGATTRSFNKFLGVSGGNGEKIGNVASMIIGDPLFGGALGALFGKGRKTKPSVYTLSNNMPISSEFDYTKAFTEGAWYDRAGQEEAQQVMPILGEAAKASAQQIEMLVAALPEEFRGKVEAEIAASSFSAGRGVPGMDKKNWNFQFYDEEQLKERLEAVVKDIQVAMGKTAQQAMTNVDLTSMYTFDLTTSEGIDRAVQAVTSVKEITDATKEISQPASALVEQAKAAKKQMDEWTASMKEFGVVETYAKQVVDAYRQANIDAAMKDIADATSQIVEPTSQLVLQAQAAKKQMEDWIAGMKEYGADMDKVNAVVSEYQRVSIKATIDALEASLNPLSQYEQAIKAANQSVDDHKAALAELGASEAEIARVEGLRAQVLESMIGPMKLAFDQDLQLRQAQLSGDADKVAALQLAIKHERELADVRTKFGGSSLQMAQMQLLHDAENKQLEWMQQQAAELKGVQEQAKAAQNALSAAVKAESDASSALSKAQSALNAARSAYLSALNKEAASLKSTMDAVSRAVEQLSRTRRDLLTSADSSPLGTAQRYALSEAELERTFAKAMGGDVEAMADLSRLSEQYLDVSKEANADFSKYRKDFERVQNMLAAVEASGGAQMDANQKQLDLLNAQIAAATEGTAQIVGSIKELEVAFVAALGNYNAAQEAARKAQAAAEEARRKAEAAADKAQQDSQQTAPKSWMQDVLERKTAAMNRGETLGPGQVAGGWTLETVLQEMIKLTGSFGDWYKLYGKAEGFAKGGLASGWALVGEEGPELVNFSSPGRVYTADDTAEMLNAGTFQSVRRLSVSENADRTSTELLQEIRALRREVAELRAEQGRSQFRIADATQRTARKLEQFDFDGLPEIRAQ